MTRHISHQHCVRVAMWRGSKMGLCVDVQTGCTWSLIASVWRAGFRGSFGHAASLPATCLVCALQTPVLRCIGTARLKGAEMDVSWGSLEGVRSSVWIVELMLKLPELWYLASWLKALLQSCDMASAAHCGLSGFNGFNMVRTALCTCWTVPWLDARAGPLHAPAAACCVATHV